MADYDAQERSGQRNDATNEPIPAAERANSSAVIGSSSEIPVLYRRVNMGLDE